VGAERRLEADLGYAGRELRSIGRRRLALAERRRRDGQGAFWGDKVGPNPTDRGKNGTKRSVIVEADGGPLGVVVAGANIHDTKLLKQTIEAIVVDRPEPTDDTPQHLCLDKGYDNPTGRMAAAEAHYVLAHSADRRGKTRREESQAASRPPMGRGADAELDEQVSCDSNSLRQEVMQLPGSDPTVLRPALVSPSAPPEPFEIVT